VQVYGLAVSAIQFSGVLDAEGLTAVAVEANSMNMLDDSGMEKSAALSFSTDASCARAFA
jgi:hypothetical protein